MEFIPHLRWLEETLKYKARYFREAEAALPTIEGLYNALLAAGLPRWLTEPYPTPRDADGPYLPVEWSYGVTFGDSAEHRHFKALRSAGHTQYQLVLRVTAERPERVAWTWLADPLGQWPVRKEKRFVRDPSLLQIVSEFGHFDRLSGGGVAIPREVLHRLTSHDWAGPHGNRANMKARWKKLEPS